MLYLLILTLSFLCGSAHGAFVTRQTNAPLVAIKNGSYTGLYNTMYNQDFFLGIPFAQPPVGNLRFRNPVSLNTTWQGVRNATEYSAECYGYGSDDWVLGNPVSEDCLTLNIIRPAGISEDAQLPVGVWIYGGGFFNGGSLDPRYNMSFIVEQSVAMGKPFIGVSLNYRLHAFGFLFGTEILKAGVTNLGFRDQRLALHWIQENIAAFGGDPSKVTIWGESAGGASVGLQTLAYGGRDDGLFRGAIEESGGPVTFARYVNASSFDQYYNNITRATNCSSASDTLACLRQVPIEALSAVFNSSVTAQVPSWGPQIDNDIIIESGTKQLQEGKFVKVPLLHGTNFDEGTAFATPGVNTTEQFIAAVMQDGPDNATAQTVAALYPDIPAIGIPATLSGRPPPSQASLGAQWKRECAYQGDLVEQAPRRLTSQSWASQNVSSWSYHFNVVVNGVPPTIGATHFQEVAFVFHNLQGLGYNTTVAVDPFANEPASFDSLAMIMSRVWVSFIVEGTPNGNNATSVQWPIYTLEAPQNIVFDVNSTNLLYAEPDYYRAEGIQYIQDRLASVYGR
ncbi:hypothetical protein HRR83_007183 [Exophiala dermatitidis]|nr:hypothetical protein HRR75_006104 [Exophiala dermatitidis]KAJ4511142.1 hypothetical protein HRR73_006475 [Exophiala dermatitidis]KAJ4511923.1 hypothetical protein HRR74_006657 [Exophiala dermatitidis]KAJ4534784.1 hypothetical protein HRR76_006693 [Exophiala dermatitidis]KAJ4545761.1 hypothetical protein HRR78_006035 [Exophiala dermatitidis]